LQVAPLGPLDGFRFGQFAAGFAWAQACLRLTERRARRGRRSAASPSAMHFHVLEGYGLGCSKASLAEAFSERQASARPLGLTLPPCPL
jgi:hypothetical protein